ncbi:hypothetical protein DYBT9275_02678 [Dyadobacter sp. CECT 9275]|uniref:Uncharacterized protein n=1 Tax=Dyadobacter helix TaxID=2822344 RepID=A0A916JEM2_9BACT|nr:hypothetical protein DYBT9275_02678 [Dyadobacter sp. CECT 9275]
MKLNELFNWMKYGIIVHNSGVVVEGAGNNRDSLIFIKIPNRLSRDFVNRRDLLQNIGIDLFFLFKEGDFLLVSICAELKRQRVLLVVT